MRTLLLLTLALTPLAAQEKPELAYPLIQDHGGIVRLPDAVLRPRPLAKAVFDVTRADRRESGVLTVLDLVSRYVNLYAEDNAGPKQGLQMAVVMHGGTTASALSEEAYQQHFGKSHPDAKLIRALAEAGVEFYVCGQSLTHGGFKPEETAEEVQVAVAAAVALIELQRDGYSYMPLF